MDKKNSIHNQSHFWACRRPPGFSPHCQTFSNNSIVISKQDLIGILRQNRPPNLCGMLRDGRCYAPASFHNEKFFLFANRQAYIRHFLSYYFSSENLTNDNYLTQQMDAEGCLPATVPLYFPRLSALAIRMEELLDAVFTHELLEIVSLESASGPIIARRDRFPKAPMEGPPFALLSFNPFGQPPPPLAYSQIFLGTAYQYKLGLNDHLAGDVPLLLNSLPNHLLYHHTVNNNFNTMSVQEIPHSNESGRSSSSGIGSQSSINPTSYNASSHAPQFNEDSGRTKNI